MNALTLLTPLTLAAFASPAVAIPSDDHERSCSSSPAATAYEPEEKNIVETALAAGSFKTLATALEAAGLVDALQGDGPFTVFAPTDEAFARIPEAKLQSLLKPENRAALTNILTYHVVPGRVAAADVVKLSSATALNGQRIAIQTNDAGVRVAESQVVETDIACANGIIHVVDSVMMPASLDIVGTAVEAGTFKTLAAALEAAELVEALQGEGPFTVFAPTDEAFAALPEGTVESLLKPENREKLVGILTYHVVPGRVYSDQLSSGEVATLQSSHVKVKLTDGGAYVNAARVTSTDIEATNGVIHVIDKVLLPKD